MHKQHQYCERKNEKIHNLSNLGEMTASDAAHTVVVKEHQVFLVPQLDI